MKARLTALLCALIMMMALIPCASAEDFAPMLSEIDGDVAYVATVKKQASFLGDGLMSHYVVQQGAATDGEYGYFLVLSNVDNACAIFKVSLTDWSIVETVYNVPVEHGNDLTYNPVTGQLIAVHCKPTKNRLSFIDPATLEVTGTLDMPIDMCSLSYNAARNQYVIGHYDNRHFSIADADFNIIATYDTAEGTLHNQGSDCDDRYIYLLEWDKKKLHSNSIVVYDWEGNHVSTITVKSMSEVEAILHTDDTLVIAFYAQRTDVCTAQVAPK